MEYCPRGTLYDVLKNPNENISWERVLTYFTQTVKGSFPFPLLSSAFITFQHRHTGTAQLYTANIAQRS